MSEADPTPMAGAIIAERYQVVRVLGHGSNGAVCEVVDLSTGGPAALKVLIGEDDDLAARLVREGKALSMLAHPHIVALVDTGNTIDLRPYVVTELIRGVSLRDVLDREIIEPARALDVVRQLLEALDHVHGVGMMIHRDIKPENIMLAEGGQPGSDYVKLLDLGVAKLLDPVSTVLGEGKLTRAGLEVIGSPPYIAPETAIGEPIDARTDLYSVGVVLFEMLTSQLPFDHEDTVTLLRMHVTDVPPPLHVVAPNRTFTPQLEYLVAQALAKLPDHRFASAMDMHAAILSVARSLASGEDPDASTVVIEQQRMTVAPAPLVAPPAPPVFAPPPVPIALPPPVPRAHGPDRPRKLWSDVRHFVRELSASARRHPRRVAAIGTAGVALLLIVVFAFRGSDPEATVEKPGTPAVTPPKEPDVPRAQPWLEQAEAELGKRRFGRAVAAYERALATDRALARDAKVRAALIQIAGRGDAVNAVVALELLATRLEPPDTKAIAELASGARLPDVRRRAFAIAERDGFAGAIDRFASWTADLRQIANCEDRRETIAKLRELGDKRAIDVLQKVRAQACITKDVTAVVEHLQQLP